MGRREGRIIQKYPKIAIHKEGRIAERDRDRKDIVI
jgi:hypothetical protein